MTTHEQVKLLAALQKLDSQIFKFKRELNDQPAIIRGMEERFKDKESALKTAEDELKAAMMNRKEKEMELQGKEDGIKKLQTQLFSLKTNKEYQAMEKEIAGHKADVSVIEEEIIKAYDRIDECAREVSKQKEILAQEQKALEGEKAKIAERTKEIEAALQKLNADRGQIAQQTDKKFLSKYERILNSKNGLAMVSVAGNACGGCNINLPPQVINEISMAEELIFCGSCARILYIDEDENR